MDVATQRDLLALGVVHRPWLSFKLSAVYVHTYIYGGIKKPISSQLGVARNDTYIHT